MERPTQLVQQLTLLARAQGEVAVQLKGGATPFATDLNGLLCHMYGVLPAKGVRIEASMLLLDAAHEKGDGGRRGLQATTPLLQQMAHLYHAMGRRHEDGVGAAGAIMAGGAAGTAGTAEAAGAGDTAGAVRSVQQSAAMEGKSRSARVNAKRKRPNAGLKKEARARKRAKRHTENATQRNTKEGGIS
jgi:hypothetical protein